MSESKKNKVLFLFLGEEGSNVDDLSRQERSHFGRPDGLGSLELDGIAWNRI